MNGPFSAYIATRRAKATRVTYNTLIKKLLGDPDEFLGLAQKDKKTAEDSLIKSVVDLRGKIANTSLFVSVGMVKSFLDFYEVPFNWKRVKSVVPVARSVAFDRAPTLEEIRTAVKMAAPRERVAALLMASGGLRVGALPGLKLKDVEFLPSGLAKITVYRGEPEQYLTFVTPEAVEALKDYLASRERIGEKLSPESPLFRDKWDYQGKYSRVQKVVTEVAKPIAVEAIASSIRRLWQRTGIRTVGDSRPFKADHGFRKRFKTSFQSCPIHGQLDTEVLMGHYMSYHKPTPEHLEEVYLAAVPVLSIDERFKLKQEIATKEKEHNQAWKDLRFEVLTLKDENREIKEAQSVILGAIMKGEEIDGEALKKLLGFKRLQAGQTDETRPPG